MDLKCHFKRIKLFVEYVGSLLFLINVVWQNSYNIFTHEYFSFVLFIYFFTDKAKSLFNCGTRMEKALQRLAEANLTTKSKSSLSTQDSTTQTTKDNIPKVNIAIVDNPPNTPSIQTDHFATLFKGIPKALLEKVRIICFEIVVDTQRLRFYLCFKN